jgi:hypothetical protein
MFRHPKYYKELRKRNKLAESRQPVVGGQQQSDQVISRGDATAAGRRSPGPGLKLQAQCDSQEALQSQSRASSSRRQAPGVKLSNQPVQASGGKRQAPGSKLQASSHKLQA